MCEEGDGGEGRSGEGVERQSRPVLSINAFFVVWEREAETQSIGEDRHLQGCP